jgi:hypothetical protein
MYYFSSNMNTLSFLSLPYFLLFPLDFFLCGIFFLSGVITGVLLLLFFLVLLSDASTAFLLLLFSLVSTSVTSQESTATFSPGNCPGTCCMNGTSIFLCLHHCSPSLQFCKESLCIGCTHRLFANHSKKSSNSYHGFSVTEPFHVLLCCYASNIT